jgi:hypothetical protein
VVAVPEQGLPLRKGKEMKTAIAVVMALALALCSTGCKERTTSDKVSDAVGSAGEAVNDAAKATGKAVGDAADATGKAVEDATK